jgi:hypothetical protein
VVAGMSRPGTSRTTRSGLLGFGSRSRCALMCADQPPPKLSYGGVGRRPVERHQRRRHSRSADDVGAPPVLADGPDLDGIGLSCDQLVKSMHSTTHGQCATGRIFGGERDELYAPPLCNQAKAVTKRHPHYGNGRILATPAPKKICVSEPPQDMHGSFTGFPQLAGSRSAADTQYTSGDQLPAAGGNSERATA